MPTGTMTVEITQAPAITGRGSLQSDNSGQIWFDYADRPYPSPIDWKKATTLTFKPDMGKQQVFYASKTQYFFNAGWTGPRLVLQAARR